MLVLALTGITCNSCRQHALNGNIFRAVLFQAQAIRGRRRCKELSRKSLCTPVNGPRPFSMPRSMRGESSLWMNSSHGWQLSIQPASWWRSPLLVASACHFQSTCPIRDLCVRSKSFHGKAEWLAECRGRGGAGAWWCQALRFNQTHRVQSHQFYGRNFGTEVNEESPKEGR